MKHSQMEQEQKEREDRKEETWWYMERQVKAAMKITMFRKNEGYSSQSESLHVR